MKVKDWMVWFEIRLFAGLIRLMAGGVVMMESVLVVLTFVLPARSVQLMDQFVTP